MDGGDLRDLTAALTGDRPLYHWQRRLLDGWLAGERWHAVDVPTGLGKTTAMTLWLIARALGASLPRRLIYVVDRRAVVDQATKEADDLARRLGTLLAEPAWGERLRAALGLRADATSLPVSTLRGQHLDNQRWREDPASSAVVVGTVDMIGSRLLFEGYGVSRRIRPAHAGLIGIDTLVLLDEAHLVPPFEALVRQAAALGDVPAPGGFPADRAPPIQMMTLSATGAAHDGRQVFRLCEDDRTDPRVESDSRRPSASVSCPTRRRRRSPIGSRIRRGNTARAAAASSSSATAERRRRRSRTSCARNPRTRGATRRIRRSSFWSASDAIASVCD